MNNDNNKSQSFKAMSLEELFEHVRTNPDNKSNTKPAELELVNRVLELLKAPTLPDYYVSSNLNINIVVNAMLAKAFINILKHTPIEIFAIILGGEQRARLVRALAEYAWFAQKYSRKDHGVSCPYVVIDPSHKGVDLVQTPKQN